MGKVGGYLLVGNRGRGSIHLVWLDGIGAGLELSMVRSPFMKLEERAISSLFKVILPDAGRKEISGPPGSTSM
jgi:hypothetical protein